MVDLERADCLQMIHVSSQAVEEDFLKWPRASQCTLTDSPFETKMLSNLCAVVGSNQCTIFTAKGLIQSGNCGEGTIKLLAVKSMADVRNM